MCFAWCLGVCDGQRAMHVHVAGEFELGKAGAWTRRDFDSSVVRVYSNMKALHTSRRTIEPNYVRGYWNVVLFVHGLFYMQRTMRPKSKVVHACKLLTTRLQPGCWNSSKQGDIDVVVYVSLVSWTWISIVQQTNRKAVPYRRASSNPSGIGLSSSRRVCFAQLLHASDDAVVVDTWIHVACSSLSQAGFAGDER